MPGQKDDVGEGNFLLKRNYSTFVVKRILSVRNSRHTLPLIQPVISSNGFYCSARPRWILSVSGNLNVITPMSIRVVYESSP